jgi:hypothetical protein
MWKEFQQDLIKILYSVYIIIYTRIASNKMNIAEGLDKFIETVEQENQHYFPLIKAIAIKDIYGDNYYLRSKIQLIDEIEKLTGDEIVKKEKTN